MGNGVTKKEDLSGELKQGLFMREIKDLLTAIIAFCAFFGLLSGVILMFLKPIEKDIEILKIGQVELNNKMDKRFEEIDKRLGTIDKRLGTIDKRLGTIDKDFEDLKSLIIERTSK